jgi:ATP-dependent RNA helicase MSS116
MLKTTLSRQSRLCLAAARNVQVASKVASRPVPQSFLAPRTRIVSRNAISVLSRSQPRLYSTEAAEAAHTDAPTEPAKEARVHREVSKFSEMPQIGVYEPIVSAITRGFKYEDMTDVQRLTINAALDGKDM